MSNRMIFSIKQMLKMGLQNVVLPLAYYFWRGVYAGRKPDLIIFADAHHDELPFSMERIHQELLNRGYTLTDVFCNYSKMSPLRAALCGISFMKRYARAKYVFICDNFLPVASCAKRKETTVVQLMHSSGLLKKIGYDTTEDIPANYRGTVYRNYDLITVSAPCCVEPLTGAMRQASPVVQPLGTSRTDCYLDPAWTDACKKTFFSLYPEAAGKTIILWAPTFRGNAAQPQQAGMEAVQKLAAELGEQFYLIRKVHPHVEAKYHLSNCELPTEQLLPVADLMITDYSSVVIDYLFFDKPYVLFAPDLEEYSQKRGFYVDYDSLTPYVVTDCQQLKCAVLTALDHSMEDWISKNRAYHLESCDGRSTARILDYLGLF